MVQNDFDQVHDHLKAVIVVVCFPLLQGSLEERNSLMVGWIIQILQHGFKDVMNHITAEKSELSKHKNGLEHMTLADIREKAAASIGDD